MSGPAIRAHGLSKRYRIGAARYRATTLKDAIPHALTAPYRVLSRLAGRGPGRRAASELIWALEDVSFEVGHGEAVGIIGRNGAGKSTLLKILSRITRPTSGWAQIDGRVGSLLEVGTGFHPELTGRDNIFLNGAILGMRRVEIERRFDEIVAFSEIEKFLDTPVKHYSSGMYVRLAFAVAAHLEHEILIVDEVLAVGDAAFQKKCLGKMGEVGRQGRTVLFVSHNMAAVESLCPRAILLEGGRIGSSGDSRSVVTRYLSTGVVKDVNPLLDCERTGNGKVRITEIAVEDRSASRQTFARSGEPLTVTLRFENHGCAPTDRVSCGFSVHTDRGVAVFHYYSHFSGVSFANLPPRGEFRCRVPGLPLAPGQYLLMTRVVLNGDHVTGVEADFPAAQVPLSVVGADFYGTGSSQLSEWGPVLVKGEWTLSER
ncbi:MAG TPA: ABC transporter ATP-binding protein [Thermoanaerobaculaceae bacterium]|nr:ABC transporter ATP-binding protein [Thermoanaerobaculaceae bacterium]